MYSIGDLAQLGGVTPRMLRHYHALGVLVPSHVDEATGYRRYGEAQLGELMQVLALKDLGFALADITRVVAGGVEPAELRRMLAVRRAELETELNRTRVRLERVEERIRRLENQVNNQSDEVTVTTKRLPALHLAVASAVSPTFNSVDVGPTIQPLYPRLIAALEAAGVQIAGPSVAFYEEEGDGIRVHAGFPIDESITVVGDLEVVDLVEVELAATAIHHGDMATVDVDTAIPMLDWVAAQGYRSAGFSREVYLECPEDRSRWRTELQFPIEPDHDHRR